MFFSSDTSPFLWNARLDLTRIEFMSKSGLRPVPNKRDCNFCTRSKGSVEGPLSMRSFSWERRLRDDICGGFCYTIGSAMVGTFHAVF